MSVDHHLGEVITQAGECELAERWRMVATKLARIVYAARPLLDHHTPELSLTVRAALDAYEWTRDNS